MVDFFGLGKFFSSKKKEESRHFRSKVDSEATEHLDEIFAEHFTQSGGFFNYVADEKEALQILKILCETLQPELVYCLSPKLQNLLKQLQIQSTENCNDPSDMALIDCECLVAFDGSIMVSYDSIGQCKVPKLPSNIVIFASPSQIVANKSKGLESIRRKKSSHVPSNITSLNGKKSQDFLKPEYIKELYLLLIEETND